MNRNCRNAFVAASLMVVLLFSSASAQETKSKFEPLTIQGQGSFAVGGKVITNPVYQVPANPRKLSLVFLHGTGQFSKTWETTPDGREGFQTIFLRRRFPVYLIDQPRRGNAGRGTVPVTIAATPDEQQWFDTFRIGIWPDYFPGVQFSKDPEALNQYFRQMTPNLGAYDPTVNPDAFAALFDKSRKEKFRSRYQVPVGHFRPSAFPWASS